MMNEEITRPPIDSLACVKQACELYGQAGQSNLGSRKTYGKDQIRYLRCRRCGCEFSAPSGPPKHTALWNTKVPEAKAIQVAEQLAEGTSMKGTAHVAKVDISVVRRLNRICHLPGHQMDGALNHFPQRNVTGRPQAYGALVRPLARKRRGQIIPATPAQTQGEFPFEGRTIRYASWHGLVTTQTKAQPDQATFPIHVFYDPRYKQPLVVATDLTLSPDLIFQIYRDRARWAPAVEHPPLATKQMLGLHRQIVFAAEACFRFPDLGLLAGNLLCHTAALLPPTPQASGIVHLSRRRDACAACWPRPFFQT